MPGPLRTFAREIPVTSGIKPVRLDYLLAVAAVRRIVRVFTNRLNIIHFINNHIHLYKLSYQFKAWAVLGALMLGFAGLFAAYYPPISGIEDETGFLNQAIVWSRGAVSSEGAGFPCGLHDFIELKGRHVPARHPGRSLLALPLLVLGGTRATFVSGLALHLLATLAGAALLVRLGRSPLWAVLILFHPTLAVYSRTVLADGAAGAGLLLAAFGSRPAPGLRGSGGRTRGHDALLLGARPAARRRLVRPPAGGHRRETLARRGDLPAGGRGGRVHARRLQPRGLRDSERAVYDEPWLFLRRVCRPECDVLCDGLTCPLAWYAVRTAARPLAASLGRARGDRALPRATPVLLLSRCRPGVAGNLGRRPAAPPGSLAALGRQLRGSDR